MSKITVKTFLSKNTTLKHSAYLEYLGDNKAKILHNGIYIVDGVITALRPGDVVDFGKSVLVDSFLGDTNDN